MMNIFYILLAFNKASQVLSAPPLDEQPELIKLLLH